MSESSDVAQGPREVAEGSYPTVDDLFQAILEARQWVYKIARPTPFHRLSENENVFIKREDLSPIHAYKWRGAYNRMRLLSAEERVQGVVCASAGNHAQGVALATQSLETHAEVAAIHAANEAGSGQINWRRCGTREIGGRLL
jgi:threonine dehydratase